MLADAITYLEANNDRVQSTNQVEIVGTLRSRTSPERGNLRPKVTPVGGLYSQIGLLVQEPDGASYTLPLKITETQRRLYGSLLQDQQRVALSGWLDRRITFDTRFKTGRPGNPGLELRVMEVRVASLRAADEHDVDGSWVRLDGVVDSVPQVRRHEQRRVLVARSFLTVAHRLPAGGGAGLAEMSRAAMVERVSLPFEVEEGVAGCEALLRRNNHVLLEGRLDSYIFRRSSTDPLIAETLRELECRIAALQLPQDQHQARLTRARNRLLSPVGFRVRVARVELKAGASSTWADARRARAAWAEQRRRRQES